MSQRALLLAVVDVLQAAAPNGLALPTAQCQVMTDGQPPPACGELFVAVHPGEWTTDDVEGLKERFGFEITVTVRVAKVPRDELGINALVGPTGKSLDDWLEKIRAHLHLDSVSDQIINTANTTIGAANNGFVEPPRFRGCGRPEIRGPDWFSAEPYHGATAPVGLSQTLRFSDAVRVQRIESED